MEIAISVKNISKSYRLYKAPPDKLKEILNPFGRKYHQEFRALNDVSFEIKKGESVGIVGRNGSGKSTLLKLICGVLQPTSGEVSVQGRVSALLELGAGFNQEYTGRQNVYMNGALRGLTKEQVDEKLESILDFADIGDFIDQSVKTYSSGMYVRLAFSCAVNVEPDILIVDEALSVGDIRFKHKCFRKIESFREAGKTVLMVTHDIGSVKSFCDNAIWINNGKIEQIGKADAVVRDYSSFMNYGLVSKGSVALKDTKAQRGNEVSLVQRGNEASFDADIPWEEVSHSSSFGDGGAIIKRVAFYGKDDFKKIAILEGGESVVFSLDIEVKEALDMPIVACRLDNKYGMHIFGVSNLTVGEELRPLNAGERVVVNIEFVFPKLGNGHYVIAAAIANGTNQAHVQQHFVHEAYIVQVINPSVAAKMGHCIVLEQTWISLMDSK
ncbi:MAG: ABC transporter ATP-binding protein [Deltaproteobacteria bacterium]|nr:ABC transporter ATP-binding protein [Deltaproteobacteria bacterium]